MTSQKEALVKELEAQLADAELNEAYIDLLNQLSNALRFTDVARAYEIANKAYELVTHHFVNYTSGLTESLMNLAWCERNQQNMEQALQHALQAESIYTQNNDNEGLLRLYFFMVRVYYDIGDYTNYLDYALCCLKSAKIMGRQWEIALAYENVGLGYKNIGELQHAIEHYARAEDILIDLDKNSNLGAVKFNQATCLLEMGRLDDALQSALEAYKLLEAEQTYKTAISLGIVGLVYYKLADYETALLYQQKKHTLVNILDSDYMRCYTLCDLGTIFMKQGRLEDSLEHLEAGIHLGEDKKLNDALLLYYPELITIYKQTHNYEQALHTYEKMFNLHQQIYNEKESIRRKTLMIQHETQQALQEAQTQRERAQEVEQQAREDREYFEQLNLLRDEFIQSAAHDLKNPLAGIMMKAYILRNKIDKELVHQIDTIERQAKKMNDLIHDMLELAKLETNRALNLEQSSLSELIKQVVQENQTLATVNQITIEIEMDDANQDYTFYFDNKYMHRVLDNLISNAIKYSPEQAQVKIQIQRIDDNIQVEVKDSGYGIKAEELPRIFERFHRVSDARTENINGTGLGLSIVKRIIEQHQGLISVESEIGVGTTFRFTLPFENQSEKLAQISEPSY